MTEAPSGIKAVIEDGSWFVLYAVSTTKWFRCDLELQVEPLVTIVLDRASFARLGRNGSAVRQQPDGDWVFRLSPHIYLTVSADQAEEFFSAYGTIASNIKNKEDV